MLSRKCEDTAKTRVRELVLPYLKTGAKNISPIQKVSLINLKLLRIGMNMFHTVYQKLLQSVIFIRKIEQKDSINSQKEAKRVKNGKF